MLLFCLLIVFDDLWKTELMDLLLVRFSGEQKNYFLTLLQSQWSTVNKDINGGGKPEMSHCSIPHA